MPRSAPGRPGTRMSDPPRRVRRRAAGCPLSRMESAGQNCARKRIVTRRLRPWSARDVVPFSPRFACGPASSPPFACAPASSSIPGGLLTPRSRPPSRSRRSIPACRLRWSRSGSRSPSSSGSTASRTCCDCARAADATALTRWKSPSSAAPIRTLHRSSSRTG